MKLYQFLLSFVFLSLHSVTLSKEPVPPTTGFAGCAAKVLTTYPGYLLSVEAEGNEKGEFFYEFDVFIKDRSNPKNSKEMEVECDPVTTQLTDVEEEVNPKDPKFAKIVKISKAEAEKQALKAVAGKIVDREYSIEKGNPIYEFDILDKKSKKEIEVEIDGVTGKVLEKEYEFFEVGVES